MSVVDDEYWYVCKDCDGEGTMMLIDGPNEWNKSLGKCPGCGGKGVIEGDQDDEANGWVRVPN